jgi:hypothetical protein
MTKPKIRIYDGAFLPHTKSASIGGGNLGVGPTHFEWTQEGPSTSPTFFSDGYIKKAVKFGPPPNSVAWLLEPSHLRRENYEDAYRNHKLFKAVLSYEEGYLSYTNASYERGKFRFYPYGGSWIDFDKWGMYEKTKNVCIIASEKNETEGHKLRHEVIKTYGEKIDGIYGRGYQPFDDKFEILKDYRYAIVIESGRLDYYFTEKLIDAISVGCVPIYWGCPAIDKFFDGDGIVSFEDLDHLEYILNLFQIADHIKYGETSATPDVLEANLETAKRYRICEDYVFENYPDLFDGAKDE